MKKRFKEERVVSTTKLTASIVFFSFLLVMNVGAQIPINGFCRYREFPLKTAQFNILPIDYNRDGLRDIIAFTGDDNHYISLTSDTKSNIGRGIERSFNAPITQILPFGDELAERQYLVLSRNSRQVLLTSFTKSGSLSVSGRVKLPGNPSFASIGDVDDDKKSECLVGGVSINGLHIINYAKRSLTDRRVVSGRIFSSSVFIDLDYDGFADIAAFEPISQSIIFYNNDHDGKFNEVRSIGLLGSITELKAADFNSDGFTDLLYLQGGSLQVLIGDSVSSFRKKITFNSPVPISKYAVFDFNGDGFNDIAYICSQTGELYISFAKNTTEFYPPILYMKKSGLVDIAAYVDRAGRKLAALSSDGKVYLINMVRFDDDVFSITFGLKPTVVQTFDYLNDRFKDFCFIDETDSSLKLFLNERRNLFRTYFRIPISADYTEIKVDDSRPKQKTFFLYKKNNRLLEIVRVDLEKFKYWKQIVYMDGALIDLKVFSDRLADRQVLTALTNINNTLEIQTLELRDFKVYLYGSDQIAYNVKSAGLSYDVFKDVFYLTQDKDGISLTKAVFDRKVTDRKTLFTLKVNTDEDSHYDIVCSDIPVDRYKPTFVTIASRNNSFLYYIIKNQITRFELKEDLSVTPMLHYYYNEGDNFLLLGFKDDLGKLRTVNLRLSSKSIEENSLVNFPGVDDYLIQNLGGRRIYLIYSDKDQNILAFKRL